ncbi:MAG: glycoside hydrolase family 2 protein [Lachnospiraceae bacterium]|nr:glycoside hydrolase family 2 protein [Lachnospiraceae bacterium]
MARIYLNDDWGFTEEFKDAMLDSSYRGDELKRVRIPHTVKELPLHYFDESEYQMLSGYTRVLNAPKEWEDKAVLLTFEGIAHDSEVFVNGVSVGAHHCGYTAFTIDIADKLRFGEDNVITVKVDSRESLDVPPFGYVIDYMTYGGIYRDVYIEVKEKSYIEDIFVYTKLADRYGILDSEREHKLRCKNSMTISEVSLFNPTETMSLRQSFRRAGDGDFIALGEKVLGLQAKKNVIPDEFDFSEVSEEEKPKQAESLVTLHQSTGDVELWDIDNPVLYEVKTELLENGRVIDEKTVRYGFRKASFKKNGFYLNGRKIKIRGLNRHQSYPYVGYAMPDSMQVYDADILKNELGVNAVRTSHYPQSHAFIDHCDEIGLLVFTELPGWQHIGGDSWKDQAVVNVHDMVVQYRNHPSIILWGVRINESVDDDEFYTRTNAVCRKLDPTRSTGGVRCYKKGSFLEDVFTYNDFLHDGTKKGCDKKSDVTSDPEKPYLISEYNGHMYSTKAFDWEEHRMEHARRHANVLDEVAKQKDICGSFAWCMFDYNTHKDFGSGDRICYHGVMDMFRNPKYAAAVYAAQQDEIPVLELTSSMDIGEHPGCNRGDIFIITNADSVKMYKNNALVKEYKATDSPYKYMKHGLIKVDDYVGDALEKHENMSHSQAEAMKSLLNEAARVGLYGIPKPMYLKAGRLMLQYGMKMTDAVELYNKYVGDWGGASKSYRFEAIKDGKVVKTIVKAPMTELKLELIPSHTELKEGKTYDVAEIRLRMCDEHGNILNYANEPLMLKTEGDIELIGPSLISLQGGMSGTYVKTVGKSGKGKLVVTLANGESRELEFNITKE